MNIRNTYQILLLLIILLAGCQPPQEKPISLHAENLHYFSYKGNPTVLITSGEHYGALLNLDFNYVTYLEELGSKGLNLTRLFTGSYVEPMGAFNIDQNSMAPSPERFISPWQRSDSAGYTNGGNKFDLKKWDEAYFKRLHDFMKEANKRNIIVEFALFCPFYGDIQWQLSPMNKINNINNVGPTDRTDVYTLDKNQGLLEVQDNLTVKIVNELKVYPNLIYEICNEPYFGGVTMEWQHHVASLIAETEKDFSEKHLISQNIANGKELIQNPHPNVSVFNFHYATPPRTVAMNFSLNKVIGDNETGFDGNSDSTYRKEGWEFILAGGALYNNLDYSFTVGHENGTFSYPQTQPGGGTSALRSQLSYLMGFMNSMEFVKMKPDSMLVSGLPEKKKAYTLAEPSRQYALYIYGGGPVSFDLTLPAGDYTGTWLNPLTGNEEGPFDINSDGKVALTTPDFPEDAALRIIRQ